MANEGEHNVRDLPSLSVRRPVLVVVANLLIIIGGIAALLGVEVRELPNVDRPVVTIRINFPGAAPETMDAEVTSVLEGAAARVPGVVSIRSASEETTGRIRVEFGPEVDLNNAANDVREAISDALRRLPAGVDSVVVVKADANADPIVRLSVLSDQLSIEQLTALVEEQVLPEYLSVPGVAEARLFGNQRRALNIVVDPLRLASYHLAVADVIAALRNANLDVPAGSFDADEQLLLVRADATVIEESRIERIVVRDNVRVQDVAGVYYGPERATSYARLNGRPIIGVGIVRQARSNTIRIAAGVDAATERLNARMPQLQIVKSADDAIFIRGAIGEVLKSLALGVGIVILVILLFIGSFRATIVPAVAIPVALIGTLSAIWLLGYSVNLLTLLALVLATGLVVDDAIVVLENIERTRRAGVRPLAAAVLGTRQVFFAVIATTTTLAAVFLPIAFLPGTTGQLFTEFGVVLAIAVSISSFVALSLCPMLASRLPAHAGTRGLGAAVRPVLLRVGRAGGGVYAWLLERALRAPWLVVGVSLLLAASVLLAFQALERELVPPEDRGVLLVFLRGPDGMNLQYTDRQVTQVERYLQPLVEQGVVESVLSIIGRYDPSVGYIIAPLKPWASRSRSQQALAAELQPLLSNIPGARAVVFSPNSLGLRGAGTELEFALTGTDYARIAEVGRAFIDTMRERLPALASPRMDYAPTQPQLSIQIDRERASDLGVDVTSVATTLRAMVDGYEVTELNVADESVPLLVRAAAGSVNDTDDLRNLFVPGAGGALVPLSALVQVQESGIAAQLDRQGQRRAVEIETQLADDVSLGDATRALEALAAQALPPDVSLLLQGEAEEAERAARDVAVTFAVALLVVLLVLAAQFESVASALVVMTTVPFGLAAAVLALWLTGYSLNIYSQIGLIMLVGLMAKNGILIVEFADQLRDRGLSVVAAARQAATIRLRPVMMTMLSTMLGGLPLIIGGGPGAEARGAIGWVIFGGLGFAIGATLLLTPLFYTLLAPLARSRGHQGRELDDQLAEAAAHPPLDAAGSELAEARQTAEAEFLRRQQQRSAADG